MSLDILSTVSGNDLGLADTELERAANILSVQLGSLEYKPDFGIDLDFFLSPAYKFENESFKSYLMNILANNSINVASLVETIETFYRTYTFNLSDQVTSTSLIAR